MSTPSAIRTSPGTTRRSIPHPLSPRRSPRVAPLSSTPAANAPTPEQAGASGLSGSARLPGEDRQDAEVPRDRGQAALVSAVRLHDPQGQVAIAAGDEGDAAAVRRPGGHQVNAAG